MQNIPRLVKRKENGIYYCRAAVPKDLIKLIGKREVKVSLGTADYKLARMLVLIESAKINEEFAKLRGTSTSPTPSISRIVTAISGITFGELIDRYPIRF